MYIYVIYIKYVHMYIHILHIHKIYQRITDLQIIIQDDYFMIVSTYIHITIL